MVRAHSFVVVPFVLFILFRFFADCLLLVSVVGNQCSTRCVEMKQTNLHHIYYLLIIISITSRRLRLRLPTQISSVEDWSVVRPDPLPYICSQTIILKNKDFELISAVRNWKRNASQSIGRLLWHCAGHWRYVATYLVSFDQVDDLIKLQLSFRSQLSTVPRCAKALRRAELYWSEKSRRLLRYQIHLCGLNVRKASR